MPTHNSWQAWDDLGQLDPFWAMTGNNKFGHWALDDFLKTGTNEVNNLMEVAKRLQYPVGRDSVLDFGCGVGRLARAFRTYFQNYHGVDVSESMISKANELNASLAQTSFILNKEENLRIFSEAEFDLVYSFAVLQHIPKKSTVKAYIAEFVRVLKPEGLLVFQLQDHIKLLYRTQPRRRFYALLRRLGMSSSFLYNKLRLYPQALYFVPEREILTCLSSLKHTRVLGIRNHTSRDTPHQSKFYYVTKQ